MGEPLRDRLFGRWFCFWCFTGWRHHGGTFHGAVGSALRCARGRRDG